MHPQNALARCQSPDRLAGSTNGRFTLKLHTSARLQVVPVDVGNLPSVASTSGPTCFSNKLAFHLLSGFSGNLGGQVKVSLGSRRSCRKQLLKQHPARPAKCSLRPWRLTLVTSSPGRVSPGRRRRRSRRAGIPRGEDPRAPRGPAPAEPRPCAAPRDHPRGAPPLRSPAPPRCARRAHLPRFRAVLRCRGGCGQVGQEEKPLHVQLLCGRLW
jgi:hypothetical protein